MPSLLEKIHSPEDIKGFDGEELAALCEEMRQVIIETVSANGATWPPIWVLWNSPWL